jgi:hypothetical protein
MLRVCAPKWHLQQGPARLRAVSLCSVSGHRSPGISRGWELRPTLNRAKPKACSWLPHRPRRQRLRCGAGHNGGVGADRLAASSGLGPGACAANCMCCQTDQTVHSPFCSMSGCVHMCVYCKKRYINAVFMLLVHIGVSTPCKLALSSSSSSSSFSVRLVVISNPPAGRLSGDAAGGGLHDRGALPQRAVLHHGCG